MRRSALKFNEQIEAACPTCIDTLFCAKGDWSLAYFHLSNVCSKLDLFRRRPQAETEHGGGEQHADKDIKGQVIAAV